MSRQVLHRHHRQPSVTRREPDRTQPAQIQHHPPPGATHRTLPTWSNSSTGQANGREPPHRSHGTHHRLLAIIRGQLQDQHRASARPPLPPPSHPSQPVALLPRQILLGVATGSWWAVLLGATERSPGRDRSSETERHKWLCCRRKQKRQARTGSTDIGIMKCQCDSATRRTQTSDGTIHQIELVREQLGGTTQIRTRMRRCRSRSGIMELKKRREKRESTAAE